MGKQIKLQVTVNARVNLLITKKTFKEKVNIPPRSQKTLAILG